MKGSFTLSAKLSRQHFSRLTVIKRRGSNKHEKALWLCKCKCGNEILATTGDLRSGNTKSCGCLAKDVLLGRCLKHGHARAGQETKTYRIWQDIKWRCLNKNTPQYKNYGGRSIRVCKRWKNSFENFLDDMGECPQGFTIGRIDNLGNYEPRNCRWETRRQQSRNKRDNVWLTYNSKTMIQEDWATEIGCNSSQFVYFRKKGWNDERIIKHLKGR